ncbi:unnamed protein product [Symbiodinium microadriaticum]|nr:unnamed protein product [Symbiodinium microadriaticum]
MSKDATRLRFVTGAGEADKAPRINLKDLGLDPKLFSPSSADLISKLPDTPSSRALVLDIARAAVKQEPKRTRRRLDEDFAGVQELAPTELQVLKEADAAIKAGITTEGLLEHEKFARKASLGAEGHGSAKRSKLFDLMDKKKEIEREIFEQQQQEALEQQLAEQECEELIRQEKERLLQEQAEQARLEQLRQEKERLLKEQAEQARLEQLREEKERLLKEQAEQARLEQLREEKERLLKEQAEQARLEQLRLRVEQDRIAKEGAEKLRARAGFVSSVQKALFTQAWQELEAASAADSLDVAHRLTKEVLAGPALETVDVTDSEAALASFRAQMKSRVRLHLQTTDTLPLNGSDFSSPPKAACPPSGPAKMPGADTIDQATRHEEAQQIPQAWNKQALEEEQAALRKLQKLKDDAARDEEELSKLQARMQQRQLDSQSQAKAALLARSRSQASLSSERSTASPSPAPASSLAATTTTPTTPSEPSAAHARTDTTAEISPEQLQQMCQVQKELSAIKINSATHKLEWNYLYRLVTPNSKGQPKCDVDIYNKWHQGGAAKQELLRDFVLKCYKPNDYEGNKGRLETLMTYRREKSKSQKTNLIRGWNKVKGAMQYCEKHRLTKRCKYTNELKFLVELEDRVDDELLVRLKLEEEMSAINGDYTDDCFAFGIATEEGDEPGAGKEGNKKVVLEEWPEIIEDNLILRVKKYKDHAVKRKSTFKATEALYSALGVEIHEYQLYLDMEMEALRESIMELYATIPEEYDTSLDLLRAAADVFTSLRYQTIGQPMIRVTTGLRPRNPKDEVPLHLQYIKNGLHPSMLYNQVTGTLDFFQQLIVPVENDFANLKKALDAILETYNLVCAVETGGDKKKPLGSKNASELCLALLFASIADKLQAANRCKEGSQAEGGRDLVDEVVGTFIAGNASKAVSIANTATKRTVSAYLEGEQETWDLKKIAKTHGTGSGNQFRGLVRGLEQMGRTLKVEIDYIAVPYYNQGICQHPILSTRSLFTYMLHNGCSKLLLGGYDIKMNESRTVLRQWWERYRVYDPGHPVFESKPLEDTVPLAVYGDEGTGKRKHPCYILATKAMLNCRNNSYYRNFLYTIAAHELYRGFHKGSSQHNECLDEIVRHYSLEAGSLFREGITVDVNGTGTGVRTLYFAYVGCLGDLPFQAKIWKQERNFQCAACCPFCLATRDDLWDVSDQPSWASPDVPAPWLEDSVLATIPGMSAPVMARHDIFHLGHLGVARYFYASTLVLLCRNFGFWPDSASDTLGSRLANAYDCFRTFCRGVGQTPFVKEFTTTNLHTAQTGFPKCNFKASDSVLILDFLEDYLDRPWRFDDEGVQHTMLTAIIQYNAFHRCCWKADDRRWLSREEATKAACCLDAFISCYVLLARWAFRREICHYVLVPKLHFLKHLVLDMQKDLANRAATKIANPAMFATPDGEDFVGRIARPVRELHSSTASLGRLQIYRAEMLQEWAGNG